MDAPTPATAPPPLVLRRPPRCPPYVEPTTVDELLPYLDAVARRPYDQGLHAAWDLHPRERVLLRVDNWHDPLCVEAAVKILEKYGCQVTVLTADRGPIRTFEGHDEVEIFMSLSKELVQMMDQWRAIEREGKYDKLLWGFGGPVLSDAHVKIQRMPFVTPELLASPAHTLPYPILQAIDRWTWDKARQARRVRITDPEGTDLTFTNWDEYYAPDRQVFNKTWVDKWVYENQSLMMSIIPGHIWAKPWFTLPRDDGQGVIAGTMNHVGPFPHIQLDVENSKIVDIRGGGLFGDKLRRLMAQTHDLQYPNFPGRGLLYWWEAAVGTNPKIHRPRKNFLVGSCRGTYERMRSGVVHIGFGTVIGSDAELEAARAGLPAGHFHVHLYFPTIALDMADGSKELLIEDGHLLAQDDPGVRAVAAQYGDPDELLAETWIPAVPGINMDGDYFRDYASDPLDWTLTELKVCRKWHDLYMKMVSPPGVAHHH